MQVIQPSNSQPEDVDDISTIESSFQNFDSKFNNYNLSGNDMHTLSLLGAVGAGFKQFPFIENTTTEEEVKGDIESINIDTSGGGPVFLVYQQKTEKLLQLVKSVVTPGCANSIDRFKLTDMQKIFSTLDSLTRFEPYLSLEGVNITVDIVDTVIDCLEYGSRRTPLSASTVEGLTDIANVYHRVLDNVLNKMLPRKLQDLDVELSEDNIRAEIMLHVKFFLQETSLLKQNQGNITLDYQSINRQVDFIYRIRAHGRQFQLQQRETVCN
ncbi:uncharacterized protein LOC133181815 [Saccostrea echinata]|uniref:uncharacterized protein LOC133181815 n=1 Tax=Saccostrea echinata TaxID=191078 RepID=UPI002A805AA5|nr:uncharacterized protein LOC133181815 [Saccostrea echinata]